MAETVQRAQPRPARFGRDHPGHEEHRVSRDAIEIGDRRRRHHEQQGGGRGGDPQPSAIGAHQQRHGEAVGEQRGEIPHRQGRAARRVPYKGQQPRPDRRGDVVYRDQQREHRLGQHDRQPEQREGHQQALGAAPREARELPPAQPYAARKKRHHATEIKEKWHVEKVYGVADRLVPVYTARILARHQVPEHDQQDGQSLGAIDVGAAGSAHR